MTFRATLPHECKSSNSCMTKFSHCKIEIKCLLLNHFKMILPLWYSENTSQRRRLRWLGFWWRHRPVARFRAPNKRVFIPKLVLSLVPIQFRTLVTIWRVVTIRSLGVNSGCLGSWEETGGGILFRRGRTCGTDGFWEELN